jgi:hypothetical protein
VSCAKKKSNELMESVEMNNAEMSCAMTESNEEVIESEEMEVEMEASGSKGKLVTKIQKRIEDCWGITLRKPVTPSLISKKKSSSIKKTSSIKLGKITKPISKGKKTAANSQSIKSKIYFFNNISGMSGQEVACKLIFDTGKKTENIKTLLKPKLSTYIVKNKNSSKSESSHNPGLITHHSVHTPSGGEVGVGRKIN